MALTAEQRGKLRRDIERSQNLRTEILATLAEGKDIDLIAAWEQLEQLDQEIGRTIRKLRAK